MNTQEKLDNSDTSPLRTYLYLGVMARKKGLSLDSQSLAKLAWQWDPYLRSLRK